MLLFSCGVCVVASFWLVLALALCRSMGGRILLVLSLRRLLVG